MKVFCSYILLVLATQGVRASNGPTSLIHSNEGTTQITIYNHCANYKKDSLLVIYDRYDHTGAGIVFSVYHPKQDHTVTITGIPAGKYYVTIQWLGVHHDRLETIVRIKRGKCENLPVRLGETQEYSKNAVSIPSEKMDFAKLRVVSMR